MKASPYLNLALFLLVDYATSGEKQYFEGWKREYYDHVLVGEKLVKIKPQPVQYHLVLVALDSNCKFHLSELPAFIDEMTKDTSYSASDGGFFQGKGTYRKEGASLRLSGVYIDMSYVRAREDSSFQYEMKLRGNYWIDNKRKIRFSRVSRARANELSGRWGFRPSW